MARLACISPETVINKLVLNAVSNKNQLQSIFKILCKFTKILDLGLGGQAFFIRLMESNLRYIVENGNEKMLQNYEAFLKLAIKPIKSEDKELEEPLMNANQFCSEVLKSYFKSKSTANPSLLYCLEV